jgi:glycosyltransferase 2 family protein
LNFKNILRFTLFLGLGLLVLYLIFNSQVKSYEASCLYRGLSGQQCNYWLKLKADLFSVNFFWILATSVLYLLSNIFRSLRWQLLAEPMGVNQHSFASLASVFISYLLNLTIPRSGEIGRANTLSKFENLTFEQSFGTIVTERIIDMIAFMILGCLTLLIAYEDIYHYFESNLNLNSKINNLTNNSSLIFIIIILLISFLGPIYYLRSKIIESKLGRKAKVFFVGLL